VKAALHRAADCLPRVSTDTISRTLHEAGFGWQKSRTWCETGAVVRKKRKRGGPVTVIDRDQMARRLRMEVVEELVSSGTERPDEHGDLAAGLDDLFPVEVDAFKLPTPWPLHS
jgi:hypothetical protein